MYKKITIVDENWNYDCEWDQEVEWAYGEIDDGICIYQSSARYGYIVIPSEIEGKKVTRIDSYAFEWLADLASITIPDSVTSIGKFAFLGCTGLTSITLPSNLVSIGIAAFDECSGLESVEIPESVKCIAKNAFSDCTGLTSVIIPNGVKCIGKDAFKGCTKLESISFPDSVITDECELCKVIEKPKTPDTRKVSEFIISIETENAEVKKEWPLPPEKMTTEIEAYILHSITDQILDAMDLSDLEQWEKENYDVNFPLNTELKFRVRYKKWDEADEEGYLNSVDLMTEDFKNVDDLKLAYRVIDGWYRTYDEYEYNHELVEL